MRTGIVLLFCAMAFGQSKRPEDLAAGKILVVPAQAPDPVFAQSVVLLLKYDRTGAMGVTINHRTTVPASRLLKDVKGADGYKDPIYAGGPVQFDNIMAVEQTSSAAASLSRVFGSLYLVVSKHDLETAFKAHAPLRVYAGYCGWGPGQLDREMRLGGWYIFDGKPELVFDAKPETLWDRLIARTDLKMALLEKAMLETATPRH